MADVPRLLSAIEQGDPLAAGELLPLIYEELRQLAARPALEPTGPARGPTALVHEAYRRLVGKDAVARDWQGRGHFFAAAAEAMRRILVEKARSKQLLGHGRIGPAAFRSRENLLALDAALTRFAATDPQSAYLVELRYFGGLSLAEASELLGLTSRTAEGLWAFARAWLLLEVERDGPNGQH